MSQEIPEDLDLVALQREFELTEDEVKGLKHLIGTTPGAWTEQKARSAIKQMVPLGLLADMAEYYQE